MPNFEKTKKNKDLATSPDIRVVVETLFFGFFGFFVFFVFFGFFVFLVRSSRKEEVASQSANLRRTKHCEDDQFCSSG